MALKILISGTHFPITFGLENLVQKVFGKDNHIIKVADLDAAQSMLAKESFDFLLSDITLNGKDCITLVSELLQMAPRLKILIVSSQPSILFATRYLEAGAFGYITTSDSEQEYITALNKIHMGKLYIPAEVRSLLNLTQFERTQVNPFNRLSNQELAVLIILLEGKKTKQIADKLEIKPPTVSTYRLRIFKKLGVNNIVDLTKLAHKYSIHPLERDSK